MSRESVQPTGLGGMWRSEANAATIFHAQVGSAYELCYPAPCI